MVSHGKELGKGAHFLNEAKTTTIDARAIPPVATKKA
jgi:hypothetical protein